MTEVYAVLRAYQAIIAGLTIGAATHFGLMLLDGDNPKPRHLIGYMLLLGFVGLLATVVTRFLRISDGDARALTTAVLAIAAKEAVTFVKRRGWRVIAKAAGQGEELDLDELARRMEDRKPPE